MLDTLPKPMNHKWCTQILDSYTEIWQLLTEANYFLLLLFKNKTTFFIDVCMVKGNFSLFLTVGEGKLIELIIFLFCKEQIFF